MESLIRVWIGCVTQVPFRWSTVSNLGQSRWHSELFFMCLLVHCSGGNVSMHFSAEGVSREVWLLGINCFTKCRRKRKTVIFLVTMMSTATEVTLTRIRSPHHFSKAIGDVFIHAFYSFYLSQHCLAWRTCTYCCSFSAMVLNTVIFLVSPRSDHWTTIFF